MGLPRGIMKSIAAGAFGVAALTVTTATDAHAADAVVERTAVVAEQDASSSELRTKEERSTADRTKEERLIALRTKEE